MTTFINQESVKRVLIKCPKCNHAAFADKPCRNCNREEPDMTLALEKEKDPCKKPDGSL